jgi:hypothetical protein
MFGASLGEVGDLLRGLATLLWPVAVVACVLLFRREISELIRRLRKGKLLGQEVELADIDALVGGAAKLEDSVPAPLRTVEPDKVRPTAPDSIDSRDIDAVLDAARSSPTVALIQFSVEIERETRWLLATTGHLQEVERATSLRRLVATLRRSSLLSQTVLDVMDVFAEVRNRVVHSAGETPDHEVLRAVDAGLMILRALAAVPRERNFVMEPAVELYGDPDGESEIRGAVGVVLRTVSAGGGETSRRVFPTSRRDYIKDLEVSWEWNRDSVFKEAWFREPETGALVQAWSGSMEFVGRHQSEL